MSLEDGEFRFRPPPITVWKPDNEPGRQCAVVIIAKGLKPILTLKNSNQRNRVIWDMYEIGGIEYLRMIQDFKEAISIAYTHADFREKSCRSSD